MSNSKVYRRLLGGVSLAILLLAVIAVIVSNLVAQEGAVAWWACLAVVAIVGLIAISHFRMRMLFEAMGRNRAALEQVLVSEIGKLETKVGRVENGMASFAHREQGQESNRTQDDTDYLAQQLHNLEREIIANDSFSGARIAGLSSQILDQSEVIKQLGLRADSNDKEVKLTLRELDQRFGAAIDDVRGEIAALGQGIVESEDATRAQYATDLLRIQSRLSSLFSVVHSDTSRAQESRDIHSGLQDVQNNVHQARAEVHSSVSGLKSLYADSFSQAKDKFVRTSEQLDTISGTLTRIEQLTEESTNLAKSAEHSSRYSKNEVLRVVKSQASVERLLTGADASLSPNLEKIQDSVKNMGTVLENRIEELYDKFDDAASWYGDAFANEEMGSSSAGTSSNKDVDAVDVQRAPAGSGSFAQAHSSDSRGASVRPVVTPSLLGEELAVLSEQAQRFFNATQSKLQYQRAAIEEIPKDVSDYASLCHRFGVDSNLCPDVGGWSATVPVLRTLVDEILSAPDGDFCSLDIGSGTSTFWEALAFRERGEGRCYAVEHDGKYAARLQEFLKAHDLESWVEIVTAPLVEWHPRFDYSISADLIPNRWYDLSGLHVNDIGLVFVDGPPGGNGVYSRLPAFESIHPYLSNGSLIVMDDTIRAEEREIVALWSNLIDLDGNLSIDSKLLKATKMRYSRSEALS